MSSKFDEFILMDCHVKRFGFNYLYQNFKIVKTFFRNSDGYLLIYFVIYETSFKRSDLFPYSDR